MRCWFLGIDPKGVKLTVPKKLEEWKGEMTKVFRELYRVLKRGGHVAFEVGEVHAGKTKLEEAVLPCGIATPWPKPVEPSCSRSLRLPRIAAESWPIRCPARFASC